MYKMIIIIILGLHNRWIYLNIPRYRLEFSIDVIYHRTWTLFQVFFDYFFFIDFKTYFDYFGEGDVAQCIQ